MGDIEEILKFLREEVNENNIDDVIEIFTQKLSMAGKDANVVSYNDGSSWRAKICPNNVGGGISANQHFISDNIGLVVTGGAGTEMMYLSVDDTREAFKILIDKVKKTQSLGFPDLMKIVYDTTVEYFGDTSEALPNRLNYYEKLLDIIPEDEKLIGKISDFKGKNMAACVERAALAQNLMKFLGIDSTYKASQITNDGKREGHAYNLVSHNGKYYIFDATIPKVEKNGSITPIVTEISHTTYEKLVKKLPKEDNISVRVQYDSIRGKRKIHYNSWSKEVIDMTSEYDER